MTSTNLRVLPAALRDDIDALAAHFHATNEFKGLFIGSLVPWNDLVGIPNPWARSCCRPIDQQGRSRGTVGELRCVDRAVGHVPQDCDARSIEWPRSDRFAALSGPLVRFHGCLMRNQPETLWTRAQLAEPAIADRVATCSNWMRLQLPGKDLLVVGFWTDWGYLNDVVADALDAGALTSVTVIDPAGSAALQAKAQHFGRD